MNTRLISIMTRLCILFLLIPIKLAHANIQICKTAPLLVTSKNVGSVSYYANNCHQNWENQTIRLDLDRKSTRLNSSHSQQSRMPSSA